MVVVADAHTKTQSDIVLLSGKADSDMVLVVADHDKTQSDVADLSIKQNSDMVVVAAAHTKTQSDIVLLSDKADSDMVLVIADHDKTQSDVALLSRGLVESTAKAGTLSTTEMSTNLSESTNDHYIGRTIIWIDGVLAGQGSDITDYVGTNGVLTYTAVTDAPSASDGFILF